MGQIQRNYHLKTTTMNNPAASYRELSSLINSLNPPRLKHRINRISIEAVLKLGQKLPRNRLKFSDTAGWDKYSPGACVKGHPHGEYDKAAVAKCLDYALESRRRVKEQLKKIGDMEFYDVHFSYADKETNEEKDISVPEQGGGFLIPDGPMNPGTVHTVARGSNGHLGLYRIEIQMSPGNGSVRFSGLGSSSAAKECLRVAFDYFKPKFLPKTPYILG